MNKEEQNLNNTESPKLGISDVSGSYTDEWESFLDEFRKTESYRKSRGQLLSPNFFEWLSSNYEVPKRIDVRQSVCKHDYMRRGGPAVYYFECTECGKIKM